MTWRTGDRLTHRFNPDLGPGVVEQIAGRTLVVRFPGSAICLRLAADSAALERFEPRPGSRAALGPGGPAVLVAGLPDPGTARLADGRRVACRELWPAPPESSPLARLAAGAIDPLEAFALRLDALHLLRAREESGLGSFLGGRIRLFAHQLHVAEAASRADPVRWLLADEVGLGKTVEACLVLDHLLRSGRAERALVVAPETLTVQWLGELWRKYHQVFALLDEARLRDVERDFGAGFNPFEVHRAAVVGLESLASRPRLVEQAVEARIDVLIVDEAHRLRRPAGHPGEPPYRAVAPIAALGRHVLLLTAIPLDRDTHGFLRLLELLHPEEFPPGVPLERRLERGPLPPCTSATRRADIGGLPPRRPAPVELAAAQAAAGLRLVRAVAEPVAGDPLGRRAALERIRRALASGACLEGLLAAEDRATRELARAADAADPRLAWLAEQAQTWKRRGDKTLVFVARRETLEWIRSELSRRAQLRSGAFHEDLSPGQRDIEVAQFRLPAGPSILVSTECGGEGRNFEFCTRLVLFDLPWSPMIVEQRIGRLDRIGREIPVEIVYFRPPAGPGAVVVELYEALGLFSRPLGALEADLAGVEGLIEHVALDRSGPRETADLAAVVRRTDEAWARVQQAAYRELHRDPYRPAMGPAILARVPADLEDLTREVVLAACEQLGLAVEEHRSGRRHSIEIGPAARVSSLPGVPPGASFLGSFERAEALADESIDFFASGHPLVEGLLAWLEDDPLGRVALLHAAGGGRRGEGLLALYRRERSFEAVALDAAGHERPDWARRLTRRPLRTRRVEAAAWTGQAGWSARIRDLARRLEGRGRPVAVAAFRIE
jgi:ATP-dependent helicase HepA